MAKFVIHFAFLVAAIGYLAQRGERFFWRALGWFTVGFVANAVYGILQLGSQLAGHSLDNLLLNPLTGGAASINIYGAIGGQNIYRVNALTGDPNHLGVMLIVPLLDADARLPADAARRSPQVAAGDRARLPAARGHRDVLAQRRRRADRGRARARGAVPALLPLEAVPLPARRRRGRAARRALLAASLLRDLPAASESRRRAARPTRTSPSTRSSARSCTCTRCSGSATTTSPSTTSS